MFKLIIKGIMLTYKKNIKKSNFITNKLYFVQIRNTKDTD